jgi:hypothetical protein
VRGLYTRVRGHVAFLLCIAKAFTTIPTAVELVDLGDASYQHLHIEHKGERVDSLWMKPGVAFGRMLER